MKMRVLDGGISVSDQVFEDDLDDIAAAGIKTIINNRPDGEAPLQPRSEILKKKAEALGLSYHQIAVTSGRMTPENVAEFAQTLHSAEKPILAFCRTGTRSATLWAVSQAGRLPAGQILSAAQQAGYDLSPLRMFLERQAAKQ